MDRSVAQGHPDAAPEVPPPDPRVRPRASEPWADAAVGVALAVIALGLYQLTRVDRFYDHFVWQAAAFLEGQAAIRYPVGDTPERLGNWFFQDVLPVAGRDGVGRGLIPFPPLPALLLVPFVAVFGLTADDQLVFTVVAAIDVALAWWMLGRLGVRPPVRLGTTVLFAFGTVFWYSAETATTWYQAHIVAVGLVLLAVGLALGADPAARDDEAAPDPDGSGPAGGPSRRRAVTDPRHRLALDPRAFGIGLLFGLAATARLTVILAAPFFMLVGPGGGWWRRSWSAGIGAAIPITALLLYNMASTGHVFHPAYDHLYQLESRAYVGLGYHPEWAAEDPRYLPQNLEIMLLATPDVLPDRLRDSLGLLDVPLCTAPGATRGLFDADCPLVVPRDVGMSVLLTSPALLLLVPALRRYGRSRLVTGATLAVLLVSVANLMHFSQGWVQFGYRFANDVMPFVLVLVALGWERLAAGGRRRAMPVAMVLVVASIAVNAWGVIWGRILGW